MTEANCCTESSSSSTSTSATVVFFWLPLVPAIRSAVLVFLTTTGQGTSVDLVQVIVEYDVSRLVIVCRSGGRVGIDSVGKDGNENVGRTVVVTVTVVCLPGKANENIICRKSSASSPL